MALSIVHEGDVHPINMDSWFRGTTSLGKCQMMPETIKPFQNESCVNTYPGSFKVRRKGIRNIQKNIIFKF
uniref:Uncharacterized protein n=1 Tax=Strongyloides venezuelensis TaxID=75913 RepID=A0A0K0FHA3_STRVS